MGECKMTVDSFIAEIEKYYGSYPDKMERVKTLTKAYLRDFKTEKLPELLKLVFMNHSHNYGCPDIAAVEKAYEHAQRNNKCQDLKIMRATNYFIDDVPTEEEIEETLKLIESGEGKSLSLLFDDKIKQNEADLCIS
jgi:hypothetical protein